MSSENRRGPSRPFWIASFAGGLLLLLASGIPFVRVGVGDMYHTIVLFTDGSTDASLAIGAAAFAAAAGAIGLRRPGVWLAALPLTGAAVVAFDTILLLGHETGGESCQGSNADPQECVGPIVGPALHDLYVRAGSEGGFTVAPRAGTYFAAAVAVPLFLVAVHVFFANLTRRAWIGAVLAVAAGICLWILFILSGLPTA